ncbi:MAG: DUF1549 domain-containing protein, partial [Verrucomicrobiota bacterium]|nr:DUF1549 domain-containing protein [Verrucomicrobiota bacterium]
MKNLCYILLINLWSFPLLKGNEDLSVYTKRVDSLLSAYHKNNKVDLNPRIDDSVFVRRVYLNIVGRIPTASETTRFINSKEKDKRSKLINDLISSEGYVSHQFNWWADILRVSTRMQGQSPVNGIAYANWIKQSIRENKSYRNFVSDLITAEGMIDENGAVGFYLRDRGMELDHLATTAQVFLGTQLVCAQCHDHPFDDWTQMDYYQLAAFSTPVRSVRRTESMDKAIQIAQNDFKKIRGNKGKVNVVRKNKTRELQRAFQGLTDNFRNSIVRETKTPLKLPDDYQYDDAKPNEVIFPATPFGKSIEVKNGHSRVEAYADWMTSPENPRFTKTIVNRMWKKVFGVGLYEPVDKIDDSTKPADAQLMTYLEELMVDLEYDMRKFNTVLYNTDAFSRESQSFELNSGENFYFQGPRFQRMSAEQIWDSVVSMIRLDIDEVSNEVSDNPRLEAWEKLNEQTPEALIKRTKEVASFNKETLKKMDQFRQQVKRVISEKKESEALPLARRILNFNEKATAEYARLTFWNPSDFTGYFRTPFRNTPRALVAELKNAFPSKKYPNIYKQGAVSKIKSQLGKSQKNGKKPRIDKKDRLFRGYVRASEISSPAPDGH